MKKLLVFTYLILTVSILSLCAEVKVLAFAGSTRTDSYNKELVNEAAKIAKQMGAAVTVIDLKNYPMPFYDADLEKQEGMPKNAKLFRDLMIQHETIVIASPEYNSSIPAVLKNALDWASRSEEGTPSHKAFEGKKFALMSASPGPRGGSRGLAHLRSVLENERGTVISSQVTIPKAHQYFSEKERPETPLLREEIQQLLQTN